MLYSLFTRIISVCFLFSYKAVYLKAEKKKDPKPIDQKNVSSLHRDTRKTPWSCELYTRSLFILEWVVFQDVK